MKVGYLNTAIKVALSESLKFGLPLLTSAAIILWQDLFSHLLGSASQTIGALLLLSGVLVTILLKLYSWYLTQKKLNKSLETELKELKEMQDWEKDYDFDPKTGLMKSKTSDLLVCSSCAINQRKSPVLKSESGWLCLNNNCRKFFADPEYKAPPRPPREKRTWRDIGGY